MKKEILVLLTLGAFVSSLQYPLNSEWDNVWDEWKTKHGKEYLELDEVPRRTIWEKNMRLIDQHNLEAAEGNHSYTMGINQFGDMTRQEYNAMLSASAVDESHMDEMPVVSEWNVSVSRKAPWHWDWRKRGCVTPVKNQGSCGSCYAFAAVGALEAQYAKKTRKLLPLSEQELVDCSGDYQRKLGHKTAGGCNGGFNGQSLLYVKDKGILSEREYPYTGKVGTCKSMNAVKDAWCKGYGMVPSRKRRKERTMKRYLYSVGPLAVSVNAKRRSFRFYKSGVVYQRRASKKTNHAVLAVGYGIKSQWARRNYWIVKNSWGTNWGNEGYILIARGNNQFGIAKRPVFPIM